MIFRSGPPGPANTLGLPGIASFVVTFPDASHRALLTGA